MTPTPESVTRAGLNTLNRLVRPLAKAGFLAPPPIGTGVVVTETTGRVSGEPREVPLLGFRLGDNVLVSTVRTRSQWFRNLETDPSARTWIDGRPRTMTATLRRGFPLNTAVLQPSEPT